MNYLPHCNATYISPFNLLKTCESSVSEPGFSGLTWQLEAGAAPFEMELPFLCDGNLLLGLYDKVSGKCFGAVYFGTETQMKEIPQWQEGWVNKISRPK